MFDPIRPILLMMAEDGGGGAGGAAGQPDPAPEQENAPGSEETTETASPQEESKPDEPELKEPGYFAQLPGDKAKSEAYKALYRHQKLDELTDAYIAEHAELERLKASSARSIVVPEKGDKEGAAAFWKKLGVPDDPAEYELKALKDGPEEFDAVINACRRSMQAAKLTKAQAEIVAEMFAKSSVALGVKRTIAIRDNVAKQADRVAATYRDLYAADIDRHNAAKEDVARYESFLNETGLGDIVNKSQLAGNPQIIRAVAAYVKKHGGTSTAKGTGLGSGVKPQQGRPMMDESKDWQDFKKSRGAY